MLSRSSAMAFETFKMLSRSSAMAFETFKMLSRSTAMTFETLQILSRSTAMTFETIQMLSRSTAMTFETLQILLRSAARGIVHFRMNFRWEGEEKIKLRRAFLPYGVLFMYLIFFYQIVPIRDKQLIYVFLRVSLRICQVNSSQIDSAFTHSCPEIR